MNQFVFKPIGWIRSCFPEKFGIPRQPGLVPQAHACLEIVAPYNQPEAFRGLEGFSHVWVVFVFHAIAGRPWKATIRPPRLGGNRRIGVFAGRSGFRPNAIGQSVVQLLSIDAENNMLRLHLGGVDLLDGTPVLDIKPYLPYADSLSDARAGYAPTAPPQRHAVRFTPQAAATCDALDPARYPDLKSLIIGLLSQDPRPAYQDTCAPRTFGMRLWDLNIRFRVEATDMLVETIACGP